MPIDDGLTPDEQAFFATGELPASLQPAPATPPAPDPAPAPAITPAPAPAVPPPAAAAPPAADPAATLRAELEAERSQRIAAEARAQALAEQLTRPATPEVKPDPGPDPGTDPLGAMMHQMKTIQGNVDKLSSTLTEQQQQQLQQQRFSEFVTSLRGVRDSYTQAHPEFPEAYAFLRATRTQDLRDAGVPEAQIPQVLLQDEIAIASNALQKGKNPAEIMHGMATRYGFAKAAPPPAPPVTPAAKIAAARAGMAAAVQPDRGGVDGQLTLDSLKDASDSDLNRVVQDDAQWARVVGNTSAGKNIFDI